nr:MAG TPA: hypothetical protein [Caudoviricetes sp.]
MRESRLKLGAIPLIFALAGSTRCIMKRKLY